MTNNERLEIRLPRALMIQWSEAIPAGLGSGLIREFMAKVTHAIADRPSLQIPILQHKWWLALDEEPS